MGGEKPVMKTSQIRTTSDRLVFIGEDDVTFGGFTIWYHYCPDVASFIIDKSLKYKELC